MSVLHHVDLDACLSASTFTLLRPGGRFAFTEPNMANPQVWAERNVGFFARRRKVTPHETAFRAAELRRTFEARLRGRRLRAVRVPAPGNAGPADRRRRRVRALAERTPLRAIAGSIAVAGRRP